ncbi:MAG TPA: hypothetical protein VLJ39_09550, partial [Tepidisphaeraceae bacterium]|nr:hypothetical protein [Tepidisphaeraceae bacterium]
IGITQQVEIDANAGIDTRGRPSKVGAAVYGDGQAIVRMSHQGDPVPVRRPRKEHLLGFRDRIAHHFLHHRRKLVAAQEKRNLRIFSEEFSS